MATLYERLQGTATGLMKKYGQGTVRYIEPGTETGPAYDPVIGPPTPHPVDATVTGVSQKYIQDGYITASDLQAMLPVFDVEPNNEGLLEIDGREHQIIEVNKIPSAGTTVAWRVFVKS